MSHNSDTNECDFSFRIVLVGDPAVGKTSLLNRFVDNTFVPDSISTNGAAMKSRVVYSGKKSVRLFIVDTCGQELFRTVSRSIYNNADAVLVVYDQGNEKSFNNVQFWLREVDSYSNNPKCLKVLVANKTDLPKSAVSEESAKSFSSQLGLSLFDTSAKEDINVDNVFQSVVQGVGNKVHPSEDWRKVSVARTPSREVSSSSGLSASGAAQNRKRTSFCTLWGICLFFCGPASEKQKSTK